MTHSNENKKYLGGLNYSMECRSLVPLSQEESDAFRKRAEEADPEIEKLKKVIEAKIDELKNIYLTCTGLSDEEIEKRQKDFVDEQRASMMREVSSFFGSLGDLFREHEEGEKE